METHSNLLHRKSHHSSQSHHLYEARRECAHVEHSDPPEDHPIPLSRNQSLQQSFRSRSFQSHTQWRMKWKVVTWMANVREDALWKVSIREPTFWAVSHRSLVSSAVRSVKRGTRRLGQTRTWPWKEEQCQKKKWGGWVTGEEEGDVPGRRGRRLTMA